MIHLITYGNSKYTNSKKRLHNEGLESNWFESISIYGPEDLDLDFKNKYKKILKNSDQYIISFQMSFFHFYLLIIITKIKTITS